MRALASLGIFAETEEGAFENTPAAKLLRSRADGSLRSTALLYGDELIWSTDRRMLGGDLGRLRFFKIQQSRGVGGGHGALAIALLNAHLHLKGVVLDQEPAAAGALHLLADAGLSERAAFVPGDFLRAVPNGGDIYFLKSVIHSWSDMAASIILGCCRQAMAKHTRLLSRQKAGS